MKRNTVTLTARVTPRELVGAIRRFVQLNKFFDHRQWSIWQAEELELAARMIREGYEQGRSS